MPESKGEYINGEKDGHWYYWSPDGVLIKKEVWKRGTLIDKKLFPSRPQ
jgi:antitoxin component YwqK of YwqJK toxin-antitoxin module